MYIVTMRINRLLPCITFLSCSWQFSNSTQGKGWQSVRPLVPQRQILKHALCSEDGIGTRTHEPIGTICVELSPVK